MSIKPFHFYSALHRYLPDASEHRGRTDGRYSGSHQRAPAGSGNERRRLFFAIQLFRILAANKDICAALMGPNGDMAFVEKIEKLVEDAVLPELFTMFPQNVNDIKYAYAFCINGCVGMIKCWLTGDSDDTPEHMAYLTHNIISEAPRNFAAKVLNSAQERTTV